MKAGKPHWETIQYNNPQERIPLQVVSDPLVAHSMVGNGKLIPHLLVDTSERSDFETLIDAHKDISPGDCDSIWAKPSRNNDVFWLILFFKRPSKCTVKLEFDIVRQGGVIDQIVSCELLYLQSAREGDRFLNTLDKPRILIEVPSKQFQDEWDKILTNSLKQQGRRRGLGRTEAKRYAEDVIKNWRKFGQKRVSSATEREAGPPQPEQDTCGEAP